MMKILDKFVGSPSEELAGEKYCLVKKSSPLKVADWILTPYRKAFGGREISLSFSPHINGPHFDQVLPSLSKFEKTLWVVAAIVVSPFAIIAAFFKYFASPSFEVVMGVNSPQVYLGAKDIAGFDLYILQPLRDAKKEMGELKGKVRLVYAPNLKSKNEAQVKELAIQHFKDYVLEEEPRVYQEEFKGSQIFLAEANILLEKL